MVTWVKACAPDDLQPEDVLRFDHEGETYAIYRGPDGAFYATHGLCTHEAVHLAGGFVMDFIIECPKHNGQFDYRSGDPKGPPVCKGLKVYDVKVDGDAVMIGIV